MSGRRDYTDPGEKFENVTMMLFQPVTNGVRKVKFTLVDAQTGTRITENQYFQRLRQIYNDRNPHALIGEPDLDEEVSDS